MRVFLWSKDIEKGNKIERIEKMLRDGWVGQGWTCLGDLSKYKGDISKDEIIKKLKNDFEDVNRKCPGKTIEEVIKSHIFKEIIEWLLSKNRIRIGDIIVLLRGGKDIIAIGEARSEYRFNNDNIAISLDIAQGLDVQWLFVRDKEKREFDLNYKVLPQALNMKVETGKITGIYGIIPLDKLPEKVSGKLYIKIQEVLNAQKFRGEG